MTRARRGRLLLPGACFIALVFAASPASADAMGLKGLADGVALVMPRDPEKAIRSFEKACELGALAGCRNAATMYGEGDGIAKDPDKARTWAAKSGDLPAK